MATRVTLRQIGRKAGVSDVAVGAALGLLSNKSSVRLSAEKAEMIRRVAAEMGYQPNLLARAFRSQRTRMIGVAFRVVSNPVAVSYMIDCIHRDLLTQGFRAYLSPYQSNFDVLVGNVRDMLSWQVDGLILSHVFQTDDKDGGWAELETSLDRAKVPFVLVESDIATLRPRPQVNADLGLAMEQAAEHLISLGHRRLGFIGDHRGATPSRWAGVERALAAHPGVEAHVIPLQQDADAPKIQQLTLAAQNAGRALGKDRHRPTGLICTNDLIASSVIAGLRDAGVEVPTQVSVTGYDNSEHSVLCRPGLTSFAAPIEQMADAAVSLLLSQIQSPHAAVEARRFAPVLVTRGSTARARRA